MINTIELQKPENCLWHKIPTSNFRGTYVSDIFISFDKLQKVIPAAELKEKADITVKNAFNNIELMINSATKKAGESYISEETANDILSCHKTVLEELEKLDNIRNQINQALSENIILVQQEVEIMNRFMQFAEAGSVGLRPISIEQLNTIKMPEGYNDSNLRAKMNNLNDYKAISGVVAGGLGLASLFSNSKARTAVSAATGIIAIGLLVATTISKSKELKEECNKMIKCMKDNLEVVTTNAKNIQAAIEKVREIERIRQLAEGYFDIIRKSVMALPFHILPKEITSINFCQVDSTIVCNLQKIYNTFGNIANRKYLDQNEQNRESHSKALPDKTKRLQSDLAHEIREC